LKQPQQELAIASEGNRGKFAEQNCTRQL